VRLTVETGVKVGEFDEDPLNEGELLPVRLLIRWGDPVETPEELPDVEALGDMDKLGEEDVEEVTFCERETLGEDTIEEESFKENVDFFPCDREVDADLVLSNEGLEVLVNTVCEELPLPTLSSPTEEGEGETLPQETLGTLESLVYALALIPRW